MDYRTRILGIWLTSPLSSSALLISFSGAVCFGSNAAPDVAPAASSEPDLLYSLLCGLRSSFDWESFRGNEEGEVRWRARTWEMRVAGGTVRRNGMRARGGKIGIVIVIL